MLQTISSRLCARSPRLSSTKSVLSGQYNASFTTNSAFRPKNDASQSSNSTISEAEKHANVVGTVPYHTSYTLLRHPHPPSAYPPKLDSEFSRLGRDLLVQAVKRKGNVNFWWDGELHEEAVNEPQNRIQELYPFVTFHRPESRPFEVGFRSGVVSSSQDSGSFFDSSEPPALWNEEHGIYLLVCTHGARDCRCGDRGILLVNSIRQELAVRRKTEKDGVWTRVKVGEVAHVGGHKYAPNLLIFPFGDWLAQLSPAHVPLLFDTISSRLEVFRSAKASPAETLGQDQSVTSPELEKEGYAPLIFDESIWRGRMGLTKEEQVRLFEKYKFGKVR